MPTVSTVIKRYARDPGGSQIYPSGNNLEVKYKSWTRTPNYRQLVAQKKNLPDNSFSFTERSVSGGYCRVGVPGGTLIWSGSGLVPTLEPSPSLANLTQTVNFRLIDKAKRGQWNLPIFLAEGRKTVDMVYSRAVHLAKMANAIRRLRVGEFFTLFHNSVSPPGRGKQRKLQARLDRHADKAAGDLWLEYSYGWVPFMSDVRSAVNLLMDVCDEDESKVGSVFASASQSDYAEVAPTVLYTYSNGLYRVFCRGEASFRASTRATWRFTRLAADMPARFGLANPAEVVWELVPFSFVADWFLPIGDYLSALDAPARFSHLGGTRGVRFEVGVDWVYDHVSNPALMSFQATNAFFRRVSVTRSPITAIPIPRLQDLAIGGTMGAARTVTSFALLRQQLSRLSR